MGWTSGFSEITETSSADAFEMTCSVSGMLKGNTQLHNFCMFNAEKLQQG